MELKNIPFSINCKGQLLDFSTVKIMGVLNVTPDSFYDGGKYNRAAQALLQVEKMLEDGADIIDVGGMSSRPGAAIIPVEEELKRVLPVVTEIHQRFPSAIISIDTIHAQVALESVEAGASIVNDISAGTLDANMIPTVAKLGVPYILMHMKGRPKTMQEQTVYSKDIVLSLIDFFHQKTAECRAAGIHDVVLDVGFGFGKTIEQNYQLLNQLDHFSVFDYPMLAGVSRKSMIWKPLGISPKEALNGTTALHMLCVQKGVHLLRVHDVAEAKEVLKLWELVNA